MVSNGFQSDLRKILDALENDFFSKEFGKEVQSFVAFGHGFPCSVWHGIFVVFLQ